MKVLFTASQRGKKLYLPYYKEIAKSIQQLGYTLLDDDLLTLETDEFYSQFEDGGRQALIDFYKNELKKIQKADINVFDCSFGSLSIGFIIEKSLGLNKPTVVLHYKDNAPFFLAGAEDEKLLISSYDDHNISAVVQNILDSASELRDKRFNFFISPELLNYLEITSKKQSITKSLFIRKLILEHRNKNTTKKR
ncbi:MAG: hypothetical protein WC489_07025 [Patescibacteria group bacterium]